MSLVVGTQPTDGLWASVYASFGIRGADVPATGTHAGSPVRDDLAFPSDADAELTWEIISAPASGTLTTYEDLSYRYDPPGGTVNLQVSFTYRVRSSGSVLYDDVETIVIGTPTNVLGVTGTVVTAVTGTVAGTVTIEPGTAPPEELFVTGTVVTTVTGVVAGDVTIAGSSVPEEILVSATVVTAVTGTVSASVSVGEVVQTIDPFASAPPSGRRLSTRLRAPRFSRRFSEP